MVIRNIYKYGISLHSVVKYDLSLEVLRRDTVIASEESALTNDCHQLTFVYDNKENHRLTKNILSFLYDKYVKN